MAQFDVHRNHGARKAVIPYFVVVQSRRFDSAIGRVIVPLLLQSAYQSQDPIFNPVFEIEGSNVVLDPLQMASIAVAKLGKRVGSVKAAGDRVIAAIDLLISRAWD